MSSCHALAGQTADQAEGTAARVPASFAQIFKDTRHCLDGVYIMVKRFVLLPLLALCLMLGACLPDSQSKDDIAVVDLGRLVRDSEPGKQAQTFLENIQEDFNNRLLAQQKKVQDNPDDKKAMQELETMYVSMQQRMQTEEQNVSNNLLEHVLQTVKTFREEKKFKAILRSEAVVDYDDVLDVTGLVLDEINKLTIEFKPVTSDQPTIPATMAPAADDTDDAAAAEAAPDNADSAAEAAPEDADGADEAPAAAKAAPEAAAPAAAEKPAK